MSSDDHNLIRSISYLPGSNIPTFPEIAIESWHHKRGSSNAWEKISEKIREIVPRSPDHPGTPIPGIARNRHLRPHHNKLRKNQPMEKTMNPLSFLPLLSFIISMIFAVIIFLRYFKETRCSPAFMGDRDGFLWPGWIVRSTLRFLRLECVGIQTLVSIRRHIGGSLAWSGHCLFAGSAKTCPHTDDHTDPGFHLCSDEGLRGSA